jgi:uncharacterized protein (DUF1330 family)
MRYLVASQGAAAALAGQAQIVADGEMVSLEQPWTFGAPVVVRLPDAANLDDLKRRMAAGGWNAFAVDGIDEPGAGQGYVLGGHIMRDPEGFKPYAAAVPDVVKSYGGRFLVRGGAVTPIAGPFAPQRVVLTEYADPATALAWYTSDAYAPLLKIRLATTEARLVIMARSGDLPASVLSAATEYLRMQA